MRNALLHERSDLPRIDGKEFLKERSRTKTLGGEKVRPFQCAQTSRIRLLLSLRNRSSQDALFAGNRRKRSQKPALVPLIDSHQKAPDGEYPPLWAMASAIWVPRSSRSIFVAQIKNLLSRFVPTRYRPDRELG